jgi:hypothetical protein
VQRALTASQQACVPHEESMYTGPPHVVEIGVALVCQRTALPPIVTTITELALATRCERLEASPHGVFETTRVSNAHHHTHIKRRMKHRFIAS